jgi:ribosomal-protein-alanine N-acetyltransferase
MSELSTARLKLRQWSPADLAPFAALNADPEVMQFMPACLSRQASDAFAADAKARLAREGFGLWAVEVRGGPPFVGYVGLGVPSFEAAFTPCVEIGWRLARPAWGHGYASEAAGACLRFAFRRRPARWCWPHGSAQLRSRAVMQPRAWPSRSLRAPAPAGHARATCHRLARRSGRTAG